MASSSMDRDAYIRQMPQQQHDSMRRRASGSGANDHADHDRAAHLRQASQSMSMAHNGSHERLSQAYAPAPSPPSSSSNMRSTSQPSGLPDVRMFKRSQRPTWSCTECARRKIKCDKRIPCQPCIKRGAEKSCSLDHEAAYVAGRSGSNSGASGSNTGGASAAAAINSPSDRASNGTAPIISPMHEHHFPRMPSNHHMSEYGPGAFPVLPEDTLNLVHQLKEAVTDVSKRLHAVEDRTRHLPPVMMGSPARTSLAPLHRLPALRPDTPRLAAHSIDRWLPRHISSISSSSPPADRLHASSSSAAVAARGSPRSDKQETEGDADTALTFEYLALGRDRKRGITQQPYHDSQSSPPLPTTKNILSQPSSRIVPPEATRMLIPDKALDFVMTYAKDAVAWQHACVHTQTFQRELEAFQSLQPHERWIWTDPLWLALFFTIQCVAVHQMPPGDVHAIFGGASGEAPSLLLDAALLCLETGRYLSEPSFYTCQALAILCVTGHNVADSNLLSSHLAIGIKTAQMLNLHRLGRESARMEELLESHGGTIADASPAWRERIIQLEMGKRIWWSLVQQDYFAMPFCGTSTVNPRQHDTPMPVNVHDHELDAGVLRRHYDETDLTLVQKLRLTSKSARIVYTFFERLPQRQPASLEEHVQPYEAELVALLPSTQPRSSNPSFKFGLALRRYINVGVSHKVLVLHRAFCSIPAPASDEAGNEASACTPASQVQLSQARGLDAARQILDQVRGINPTGRPEGQVGSMWTISYQAVAAAVVVALTYFRMCADPASMPGCRIERSELHDARTVLQSLAVRSAIAARGMVLLDDLMNSFDEANRAAETESRGYTSQLPHGSSPQAHNASDGQRQQQSNTNDKRGTKRSGDNTNQSAGLSEAQSDADAYNKRMRGSGDGKDTGLADSTPAGLVLAQLDADGNNAVPTSGTTGGGNNALPAWDLEWDVGSMLQTIPDVSKLFDGSMGNLFG